MVDNISADYSHLDRPEILSRLFHPRSEYRAAGKPAKAIDLLIPVEGDIVVGGRFHVEGRSAPNFLFFHGNGEIVADYDDLGPVFNDTGVNFLAVDYRGYGRSTGMPTITAMMGDCHAVFEFTTQWLEKRGHTGPIITMGRSLGSASVLELIAHHKEQIDGLLIESGFAYAGPLLELLGINPSALGIKEERGFRNLEKIRSWDKPTLIIHAEFDHLIPFSDGQSLYEACPSPEKTLIKIPGADHNDIFMKGLKAYMSAVKTLAERVVRLKS